MCIIIYKPKGIEIPKESILKNCYESNSDGAGIMIRKQDKIIIKKGFINLEELLIELSFYNKDDEIGIHFRTGTSGLIDESMCHPFPFVNNNKELKLLELETNLAIMHNGILFQAKNDLSDTAEFVKELTLKGYKKHILKEENIKYLESLNQKFLIFGIDKIAMIGKFIEDNGIYYSNSNYKNSYISLMSNYDYKYNDIDYSFESERNLCPYCYNKINVSSNTEEFFCNSCKSVIYEKDLIDISFCPECYETIEKYKSDEFYFCYRCNKSIDIFETEKYNNIQLEY